MKVSIVQSEWNVVRVWNQEHNWHDHETEIPNELFREYYLHTHKAEEALNNILEYISQHDYDYLSKQLYGGKF
jgi:hypothetical protein